MRWRHYGTLAACSRRTTNNPLFDIVCRGRPCLRQFVTSRYRLTVTYPQRSIPLANAARGVIYLPGARPHHYWHNHVTQHIHIWAATAAKVMLIATQLIRTIAMLSGGGTGAPSPLVVAGTGIYSPMPSLNDAAIGIECSAVGRKIGSTQQSVTA